MSASRNNDTNDNSNIQHQQGSLGGKDYDVSNGYDNEYTDKDPASIQHEYQQRYSNSQDEGHLEHTYQQHNYTVTAAPEASADVGFGVAIISNTNNNQGNTTTMYVEPPRNWVVVGILIALIVMLWVILGGMLCYPLVRFIKRRMPVSKRRINRRYDTIEGWLITKVVRPHDEGCERIQTRYSKTQQPASLPSEESLAPTENTPTDNTATDPKQASCSTDDTADVENQVPFGISTAPCMKHAESTTTAETLLSVDSFESSCLGGDHNYDHGTEDHDENEGYNDDDDGCRECPVCMEAFVVEDVVSWSSYESCSHVYHHQCIKEWLLRHNNCPFCREIFLPVDRYQKKITMKVFKELSDLRARRAERTYFCIQDGLVTVPIASSDSNVQPSCDNNTSKRRLSDVTTKSDKDYNDISASSPAPAATNTNSTTSMILLKCGHIKAGVGGVTSDTPTAARYYSQLFKEKLKPGITKAELKKLRGDRCEKICFGEGTEILDGNEDHAMEQASSLQQQSNSDDDDNNSSSSTTTTSAPEHVAESVKSGGASVDADADADDFDGAVAETGNVEVDVEIGIVEDVQAIQSSPGSAEPTHLSATAAALDSEERTPSSSASEHALEMISPAVAICDGASSEEEEEQEGKPLARRSWRRPRRLGSF
ncbi:Zinc finger, C3HC4 type (RING finger) [Seminavis robusta]|uniref:Zinc finger, C3HC4 type (RING finger) n=1 Tax=Seminavis robusta TaxID=568900 RepID=A0A9N8HY07_9STRA|nr:Zinc finger, C3HC4 type (RING finger) [Seminavis robusta]|eukprot:Sro1908_g304770.1 Zinc finger, C3HC4 type (RING finger) (655) ;mRNA; r:14833-16877